MIFINLIILFFVPYILKYVTSVKTCILPPQVEERFVHSFFLNYIFFSECNNFYMLNQDFVQLWKNFFTEPIFTCDLLFLQPPFSLNHFLFSTNILTYFYTKNVILSFVIFRMTLMSQKKEEVYNILIINNLYINIYFFCFQFLEKWQVTSDNLPITTFNALILSILRAQICHFSVSLFRELSLFEGNQKCTDRAILGVNR